MKRNNKAIIPLRVHGIKNIIAAIDVPLADAADQAHRAAAAAEHSGEGGEDYGPGETEADA